MYSARLARPRNSIARECVTVIWLASIASISSFGWAPSTAASTPFIVCCIEA
jgi:hypothetical protein